MNGEIKRTIQYTTFAKLPLLSTKAVIRAPPIFVTNGNTNPISAIKIVEFLKAESTFTKKNPMKLLKVIRPSPNYISATMKSPIALENAVISKM